MQRFRLTATEKRVAAFILAAFILGLVTKCYREAHPSALPSRSDRGEVPPRALTVNTIGNPTLPFQSQPDDCVSGTGIGS
jgi:hypothetical protein